MSRKTVISGLGASVACLVMLASNPATASITRSAPVHSLMSIPVMPDTAYPRGHEPAGTPELCAPDSWEWADGGREVLYNDVFGASDSQCITDASNGPGFTITKSTTPVSTWNAFPELYVGCWHGVCSSGPLPERVSDITHLTEHLRTRYLRASQTGDDADDIWFSTTGNKQHHPDGMELMIWPSWSGVPLTHASLIRIGHRRWWYESWTVHACGTSWLYRQLRAYRPNRNALATINLIPIFKRFERRGQLKPYWYLNSVGAGYELVSNGAGNTTYSYRLVF